MDDFRPAARIFPSMNKNNITAIVLMILVVFGFSYWSSHNNKKNQQAATETTAQSSQTATVAKQTALPADTNALFAAALSASDSVASPHRVEKR